MGLRKWFAVFMFLAGLTVGSSALAAPVVMTTQGITDTEILLGTHQDLSGPIAMVGQNYQKTMTMRIDEINAKGGIHGRKLRLIVEDTGYDPKKAVLATQKLLTKDKVFALVGTFGTITSLVTLPLAKEKGIPLVFAATSNIALHTPPHPLSFGYFLPDELSLQVGLDYLMKIRKVSNVGVIYQDDELGDACIEGITLALKKYNMKVKDKSAFKRGATDFSSQVRKLKSVGIDLVVIATGMREAVGIAKEVKKQGWDVQIMAGFPPYNMFTIPLGKEAVEGLIAVGQDKIFYEDDAPPEVAAWMKKLKDEYKGLPDASSAAAYNYVCMAALGLENAGRDLTMEKFIKGMESFSFKDIFGRPPTTFSPTNHLIARKVFVAQVKNGRWVILSDWIGE